MFGLIANLLCLVVFRKLGLHKPINLLFAALAVVDALGLLLDILETIISHVLSFEFCHTKSTVILRLVIRILKSFFLRYLNQSLTLFIAFTRFIVLSEISQLNLTSNLKKTKYSLMVIAFFSVIFFVPFTPFYKVDNVGNATECFEEYNLNTNNFLNVYSVIISSIVIILLLTVSVLMLRILYKARKHANDLNISRSEKNTKTASYIILSIVFFSLFTFVLILIQFTVIPLLNKRTASFYLLLINCLLFNINNTVNVFIHSIGKKFRETLKQILFPCTRVAKTKEVNQLQIKNRNK